MLLRSAVRASLKFVNRPTSCSPLVQPNSVFKRNINIHEYQGIELLKKFGIKASEGGVATTPEEAENVAHQLNTEDLVIKAQVHSGGRGKGEFDNGFKGGVHTCSSPQEAKGYALKMLNHRLKTKQSGVEGKLCQKVFICKRYFNRRETYFAILLDRQSNGPVMVASSKGGMDIEKVAEENPDDIIKVPIDIFKGFDRQKASELAEKIGFRGKINAEAVDQMEKLYKMFRELDATLIEINPFSETSQGKILCLDTKINFDSNAMYRHPEIEELADPSQSDARENEAQKYDLNYIGLDGDIGCLVNGAGLAMATMDMIKFYGGSPANFLDIGGGASERQVTEAFRILASDINVKAILVNIFGGIMRCDIIALGILNAVKTLHLRLPIVVRLQGTNVKEAKEIVESSGLRVIAADDLDDAATKAVKVSKIVAMAQEADLDVHFELPL